MGIGVRFFLFDNDGLVHRLSKKRFERLWRHDHDESLPQYAGQRVRCASVMLEIVNRKPVSFIDVNYTILPFDSLGHLEKGEIDREMQLIAKSMSKPLRNSDPSNIVDATSIFAKKRLQDEFSWTPGPEIQSMITEAIFGTNRKD